MKDELEKILGKKVANIENAGYNLIVLKFTDGYRLQIRIEEDSGGSGWEPHSRLKAIVQ